MQISGLRRATLRARRADILVGTQEIIDIAGREGADAIVISHAAALASQGAQQGHDATAQPACQARLFGPGS